MFIALFLKEFKIDPGSGQKKLVSVQLSPPKHHSLIMPYSIVNRVRLRRVFDDQRRTQSQSGGLGKENR